MTTTLLKNARLLDPVQEIDSPGDLLIEGGRIASVHPDGSGPKADETLDLQGRWLMPGLVDLRCALREPGFEHKEDIGTGLAAAAAGGFTAVCSTPDSQPVVDQEAIVRQVLERAAQASAARLLPIGAATRGLDDEHLAAVGEMVDAGCVAITQGETPIGSARLMRRLLQYTHGFDVPVFSSPQEPSLAGVCDEGYWSTRLGLSGSPSQGEEIAAARDLALAELTGARLHLSRLSTARGVELVRQAKERGVNVTCDVTAHHLHLTAEVLQDFDPNYKFVPPPRSEADRAALRDGVRDGTVDAIVSDHQPHHQEDKARDFAEAASGISSLESVVALTLSLVRDGILSPLQMAGLLSRGPHRVLGTTGGQLAAGAEADLTVIDPDWSWEVSPRTWMSRGKNTPWMGQTMVGRATSTWVAGCCVYRAQTPEEA